MGTVLPLAACPPLFSDRANIVHWLMQPGLGNVGRNTILTPGPQDWSLTVQRMFKMPLGRLERQALTFRAEFFDAFNHPNLGINNVGNTISYDLEDPDFRQYGYYAVRRAAD